MIQSDFDEFKFLWCVSCELVNKQPPSIQSLQIAFSDLSCFDIKEVSQALSNLRKNPDYGMYAPTVANVIKVIVGNSESAAQVAWSKYSRCMFYFAGRDAVSSDKVLIHTAVEMGGVEVFSRASDQKAYDILGHQYRTMYQHFRNNPPSVWHEKIKGDANSLQDALGKPHYLDYDIEYELSDKAKLVRADGMRLTCQKQEQKMLALTDMSKDQPVLAWDFQSLKEFCARF